MLKIYKQFQTDTTKEKNGVTVSVGDGATITVARWFNPEHRAAVEALQAPYRSYPQSGRKIPDSINEALQVKAMAQAILVGWDGIADESGAPIPYSIEAAEKLLTDLKDFRDLVTVQSGTADLFKKQEVVDSVGE